MTHAFSVTKYQKYPSIFILKHANVLDQVIKLHDVNLYQINMYKQCKILKSMYEQ